MKKVLTVVSLGLAACNYDAGECWVRGEGLEGAGGGIIAPPGAGGFGDVPPQPQSATDAANPCSSQTAECVVTWAADSDVCKGRGTTSSCTTLYQCPHATLTDAKAHCEMAYGVGKGSGAVSCGPCQWATTPADEKCKELCDKVYNKCMDNCKDGDCRNRCFNDYVECLRDCDR